MNKVLAPLFVFSVLFGSLTWSKSEQAIPLKVEGTLAWDWGYRSFKFDFEAEGFKDTYNGFAVTGHGKFSGGISYVISIKGYCDELQEIDKFGYITELKLEVDSGEVFHGCKKSMFRGRVPCKNGKLSGIVIEPGSTCMSSPHVDVSPIRGTLF